MARKTREETERTYHALLDAATELFVQKGVAGTTLNDIAQAAGMTRGAVYWHFDNKDAVITALWERNAGELHRRFINELPQLDPEQPVEHFRSLIKRLIQTAVNNTKLSESMRITMHCVEFTDEETELQLFLHSRRHEFFNALRQAFDKLAEQQKLADGVTPELACNALWAYLNGLIHTHLEPAKLTIDLQIHGERLLDLILDGLLKPGRIVDPQANTHHT